MNETRLEKWQKESRRAPVFLSQDNAEFVEIARQKNVGILIGEDAGDKLSFPNILTSAKELIFDFKDEKPIFYVVQYVLNTQTFEVELRSDFKITLHGKTKEIIGNQVKRIIAMAIGLDVSIYPNTEELTPLLEEYYRDLLTYGFELPDDSGQPVRITLVNSSVDQIESIEYFKNLELTKTHSPAELAIIRNAILSEISKRDEAGRILNRLRFAIKELSNHLKATRRNENGLQHCLTNNPILFGFEYRRVIPKHKLGSEYEMDYALERASGLVDLVEIEASTHALFNQKGNPSEHLVHAEQQVIDWLSWIEQNSAYARVKLPGLMQPIGYVIIGRSGNLPSDNRQRLHRRNIIFRNSIIIFTYDDLLSRAELLLSILEGKQPSVSKV